MKGPTRLLETKADAANDAPIARTSAARSAKPTKSIQAQRFANFFERARLVVVKPEAHPQHGGFSLVHRLQHRQNVDQVVAVLLKNAANACNVVREAVKVMPKERKCHCGSALASAIEYSRASRMNGIQPTPLSTETNRNRGWRSSRPRRAETA